MARFVLAALCLFALAASQSPAYAQNPAEEGRQRFLETCANCHGLITEDAASLTWDNLRTPVVMNPVGPNLSHVYGRPAGKMEGYSYSKAFLAAAPAIAWTTANLDRWIADSQAMIRGSAMFVKVSDSAVRAAIIAYLERYARYTGSDCVC